MNIFKTVLTIAMSLMIVGGLTGCGEKKGPAETAGEKIDKAATDVKEQVEDATDKDGPLEKTGAAMDDMIKDASKTLEGDKK